MSEERFRELVEDARTSDDVLGLYLFGSRAFDDARRDERSDYDAEPLLARIDRLLAGDETAARSLFRDLEGCARAAARAQAIDAWEPDVAWLRGDAPYREAR